MKCVILAGGRGTRIAEESSTRPKPMLEIGARPILWHIMKLYASFGVKDFIVCLGHKGYVIKEYFANYFLHQADVTFDMMQNRVEYHDCRSEPWKVTLVDTGEDSMTGGRLLHVRHYLNAGEPFCMTYGDGLPISTSLPSSRSTPIMAEKPPWHACVHRRDSAASSPKVLR